MEQDENQEKEKLVSTKVQTMIDSDPDGTETRQVIAYFDSSISEYEEVALRAVDAERRASSKKLSESLVAAREILTKLWEKTHAQTL